MKEKLKNTLFVISIFYSVIIIILTFITTNNLVSSIELHDVEENRVKLTKYKKDLSLLEKNSCTEVISKIINHYEETSYNGNVNLKEMYEYDNDNSLLSYYMKAKENCNINEQDEEKYNLSMKFITSSIQRDETYQRYYFQYELKIFDYPTRLIVQPEITGIEYSINRIGELEIIEALIEICSREAVINE